MRGAADVAALKQHLQQPRRAQRRELGERLQDERPVGVDAAGAQRRQMNGRVVAGDHAPHDIAMHTQLPRDRSRAPLLDRVQAQDLRDQVMGRGHGAAGSPASWHVGRGAGSPGAASRVERLRSGSSAALPRMSACWRACRPRWT